MSRIEELLETLERERRMYGDVPAARAALLAEVRRLEEENERLSGFYRSVNEALNSGDGSYRP